MLTAPRIVRTERAVRPCLPITLPTSCGATRSLRTVFSSRPTDSTSTAAGSSTRARAISQTSSSTATISCWVMHVPLTVLHPILTAWISAQIVTAHLCRRQHLCAKQFSEVVPHTTGEGTLALRCGGWLGSRSLRRELLHQLRHCWRKLGAHAAPVSDAIVLQVDRCGVRTRIVGADDLDRAAIAGAVLLNHYDTVVGLLAGANARQTNHHHGDTVPFKSFFPNLVGFASQEPAG